MATINQIMHLAFYVLLALSGVTIFSIIVFVAIRAVTKRDYEIPRTIATWAGICTSVGSLSLSILNFNFPIGILPETDPARDAIRSFYDSIQARDCDNAWQLIHTARKKILEAEFRFGRDQFCDAYRSTQIYEGLEITREASKTDLVSSRTYRVTYDVFDSLPRNNIYELYLKDFSDVIHSNLWNERDFFDEIIANMHLYFIVPDEDVPEIKEIISKDAILVYRRP